ncbi:enolase C-terminal domain-like protein [Microbaculum marinum]|uniref:Enolase C-terminal domain-like protein n=1 Tax=Microbaculum marinum TaxID=1764581 RepID=A0AAW9RNX9_9HYPH
MSVAPKIWLEEARLYERDVRLRLPFRFGVVTLDTAPQVFLRVRIRTDDGREGWGTTAELMVPKWFDKDPSLSNEDNFEQLRRSIRRAVEAYRAAGPATAFGLAAATCRDLAGVDDMPPLAAAFGGAEVDKAVLDALCRIEGASFADAIRVNLPGLDASLTPDLQGFDIAGFLGRRDMQNSIAARHTVGMLDPLATAEMPQGARLHDGLPQSLEEVISAYGQTYFKLKIGGNLSADLDRLIRIAEVLDPVDYRATLDGNEQYADADGIVELWRAILAEPRLRKLASRVLFIEQPVTRATALSRDISALATLKPVIIDESDATLDAFRWARDLGYAGVSSKACKGLYKSLLNAARCSAWRAADPAAGFFLSGEDLTCQAGLAVQQDLALVSLLGIGHVERNGHHYVLGMAGAPPDEQAAFRDAHPDLYRDVYGSTCLTIAAGRIALGSIDRPGFASSALPDFAAMRPVSLTATRTSLPGE